MVYQKPKVTNNLCSFKPHPNEQPRPYQGRKENTCSTKYVSFLFSLSCCH